MIGALVAAAALAAPPPADRAAAVRAARWLQSQPPTDAAGSEADAVVAIVAAGGDPGRHLARLRALTARYATAPGPAAKVTLAAVAAGANPRCFARIDLVHEIRVGYADGVFGATIWDDALAIDALAAAGEPVPAAALSRLRALRRGGGWSFSLAGGADDADSTGLALGALRAGGARPADPALRAGAAWLLAHRVGGGWGGAVGTSVDANSTALGVLGLAAAGRPVPTAATRALRALQAADGSFAVSASAAGDRELATNQAVPALLRRPFPVVRRSNPGRPC